MLDVLKWMMWKVEMEGNFWWCVEAVLSLVVIRSCVCHFLNEALLAQSIDVMARMQPIPQQAANSCCSLGLFRRRCGTGAAMIVRVAPMTTSSRTMPASLLIRRQSLNNPISRQHASVHRKVSADHERTHSCVLLSQTVALVGEIGLVLPSINEY